VEPASSRQVSYASGRAFASFWGDFHDREWFYVLGRIKVFAIMETLGCFMIANAGRF